MQAAIRDAGARTLGLVATTAGLKLYQSLGFVETGGIQQWQGTVANIARPANVILRDLADADLPAVRALDAAALGAPRDALIDAVWQGAHRGIAAVRGDRLHGFALLRASGHGTTVGPLIATDEALAASIAAEALARAATTQANGIVRFDIPASASQLARLLEQTGLRCVDRVTAMRRGEPLAAVPLTRHPPMDELQPQRFGLVSQAFG